VKRIIIVLLAVSLCVMLCACGGKASPEEINAYNNATACLSQNRYVDAAKLFIEAGDYEDAQQKLLEIYYYAVNLYEAGIYSEAASLFSVLSAANINDSAQYANMLLFEDALANASYALEEMLNPKAALEWLTTARQYATEDQMQRLADYESYIEETVYYSGTQFMTLPYFLGIDNIQLYVRNGEGYTCYTHSGSLKEGKQNSWTRAWLDAKQYESDYMKVNFGSELMICSISGEPLFETTSIDDYGNAIFLKCSLSGDLISVDVYIIQPEYVSHYLKERQ